MVSQNQCQAREVQHLSASRCRRKASNTGHICMQVAGMYLLAHSPLLAPFGLT